MKRTVVFSSFNFAPSFLGPAMNMLQTNIDKGNKVYYITCLKSFNSCGFNLFEQKYMCAICVHRFNYASQLIEDSDHLSETLKLSDLSSEEDWNNASQFISKNKKIDKKLYYKSFDVGESVLSSYISKTRDMDIEQNENEKYLQSLTVQSIVVYESILRFLEKNNIEEVQIFNGRWDYYRAVFRAASFLGIPCLIFENFRPGGILEYYKNDFPHIIKNKQQKFDEYWNNDEPTEIKKEISKSYFVRKRRGDVVIGKSHTKKQESALLPSDIDPKKKLLVLFNSSDDEFAAVAGDEYKNPLFKDQVEGILFVAELVASKMPEYNLIIRMHPNLKGVNFQYVQPIYDLKNKYQNVILIEPESKVDSYALMDIANKVITFGSSIGVEANYWQKSVILLGKPYYYYSDLSYIPKSKHDIYELLINNLKQKPVENSEKIAYYFMKGGIDAPYYDYQFGKKYLFKNKRIDTLPHLKRIIFRIMKILNIKSNRNRH